MLCDFLKNSKKEIIEKWINMLKTSISPRYSKRPYEELKHTVTLAFNGNLEIICNNNWKPIEDFIIFITKLRLERGFTLSDVQRAFGLFRIILLELLPEKFQGDELKHALKKVNYSVDVTINRFSEYFQKKHDEVKENMLKLLEEKVEERTRELLNSETRYKTLVEDISDGYFVSRKGKIIFANNAFCKMFNQDKKSIIGFPISILVKNYEEIVENFKEGENIETKGIKKDGAEFPVEIKANKIFYENKPAIAGICRDITERMKIVENERLAVIGRLAAAFAHEIRNSISSIKVNIQVLKSKLTLDSIDKKRIELIFKDIEKLDKIIKDTLFFSKPIELNLKSDNLNSIVSNVLKKFLPIFKKNQIQVKFEKDKDIGDILIDREKFEIIVENILFNSIDALNDKNRKKIVIKTKQFKRKPAQALIIRDNGCGIEKENLQNIFLPFFTTKSKGMGLGLSNVERIISLINGKIYVKSKPQNFTEFKIEIPC